MNLYKKIYNKSFKNQLKIYIITIFKEIMKKILSEQILNSRTFCTYYLSEKDFQ